MKYKPLLILGAALAVAGFVLFSSKIPASSLGVDKAMAAEFTQLSQNGNSACSATFADSIDTMASGTMLKGSCCSPMDFTRYKEQVVGLQKYSNIPEIPPNPYNIDAGLAKQLKGDYDMQLNATDQVQYDYAMQHSKEKGPCCCKCWRWYVYGGLGKLLITKYHFTGAQVTEIWNLSDGCGGAS